MSILDRFRGGNKAAPKTAKPEYNGEPVLGMYLKADGTIAPVTAKAGWSSGYANYYGAYSKLAIDSTPQGYAYGYVVSVWANRCIEIRSSIIGRMPHTVVSKRTGKPIPRHPLTVALDRSQQGILRKIEWSRLIWGETFIWPVQNTFNYFSDLWWLNNLGVSVVQGAGYIKAFNYIPVEGGKPEMFQPSQICFMKTDNPFSDLRGLSPMEAVLLDVGVDKDVARTLKAWYTNDARPGMLLIPENDLLPEAAQEFTDYWKSNFKGSENAGRMGLLPRNIKEIKEMNRAPNIDDVEIREAVRRDICAGFGVPLSIAGAWDDANYQSAPEQRKSLYEDTIIPECEDIATEINNKLLPFFDDSGNVRFEFDVSKILALMEDAEKKEALLSQRLTSGGLMLNEYRLEIGKEPIPGGDVLYVPTTVTVTPIAKIGQPQQQIVYGIPQDNLITAQPVPDVGNAPPIKTPAALQAPAQPKQIPAQTQPNNFQQKAIQNSVTDELNAWEKKAIQGGAKKAAKFVCYQLPEEVQTVIREQLEALPNADKPTLKALFAKARTVLGENEETKKKANDFPLATTEEFAAYWHEYDSLMQDAGQVWLHDYMERALSGILNKLTDNFQAADILAELSPFRDELAEAWVGTTDNPGIFTRLILAGAARGNDALNRNVSMKPPMKFEIGIGIDWLLLGQQALDFVRRYVFNLIGGLDNTTRERTRTAIHDWMETGASLDDLKKALTSIFKDEARAQLIAQTETTRAYNEGSNERWRQAGVNKARWVTLNDSLVCPSCLALHGQIANIDQGWELNGQFYTPPQHPGCRCYSKPVL